MYQVEGRMQFSMPHDSRTTVTSIHMEALTNLLST